MLDFKQQAAAFELFLKSQQENGLFKSKPENLYDPCAYMLALGGKRIRPAVCLMAAEMFSSEENNDALWVAMAVELFHNFTLVHDDIMDDAPLRRGQATVYKKYNPNIAILSGDVLNIFAYQCLQKVAPAHLPELLKIFNQTAIEVCEGQQFDMDFEQQEIVALEEYIEMIKLKTAVLLAASLRMGAVCANASVAQAQAIYDFGLNLGIAFQLQDDYLDSFGTEEAVGKQIGGDIMANKKTFLAIDALSKANEALAKDLLALKDEQGKEKVQKTLTIFKSLQADLACKEAIQSYTQKALSSLNQIQIPEERKTPLVNLLHFLMQRDY